MTDKKEETYWDIPRISENDHIYRPDIDEEWEKEEEKLQKQKKHEIKDS